jgi:hypothetical protein
MLSFGHVANEIVSSEGEEAEGLSWGAMPFRPAGIETRNQARSPEPGNEENRMPADAIRRGDQVVFERLDLAEALGIWRNARGRIVRIHGRNGRPGTVDVAFEGHAVLERYLPDLFRRVN